MTVSQTPLTTNLLHLDAAQAGKTPACTQIANTEGQQPVH
jgi:hypothetical protein